MNRTLKVIYKGIYYSAGFTIMIVGMFTFLIRSVRFYEFGTDIHHFAMNFLYAWIGITILSYITIFWRANNQITHNKKNDPFNHRS